MRSYLRGHCENDEIGHFTTAASNFAMFGSYMAALFASADGSVAATSIEAAQNQALLAHPHTG